jgi:regulatory protein
MIVTQIERQKRRPNRYNVYIDGEFAVGVGQPVLVKFGLRKGDAIDDATLRSLQSQEELYRAKESAFRLLGYRQRSEHELRIRLRDKEFPPELINQVIEHFRSLGLINDVEFARAFIRDAQLRKPSGTRLIRQKLRLKGVPAPIVDSIISESKDPEEEMRRALDVARKTLSRYRTSKKRIDPKKQQQRVAQFLAGRGFDWSTISPVLKRLFSNRQSSDTPEA